MRSLVLIAILLISVSAKEKWLPTFLESTKHKQMMLLQEQTEKPIKSEFDGEADDESDGDGEGEVYHGKILGTFAIDEETGTFAAKLAG